MVAESHFGNAAWRKIARELFPRGPAVATQVDRYAAKLEVQFGHRLARIEIAEQQYGQSFVVGLAGAGVLLRRLTCRISRNTAIATITKSNTALKNIP